MLKKLLARLSDQLNLFWDLGPSYRTDLTNPEIGFSFSALEERILLSGNVVAFDAGPNLFLFGDADANDIEVSTVNDQVLVAGLNGTTINNAADFTSNTGNSLFIFLGDGDNRIKFDELIAEGGLFVHGGSGSDTVQFLDSRIGGSLHVNTYGGMDSIGLNSSEIVGASFLNTWGDQGLISIRDSQFGSSFFAFSGHSDDALVVEDSNVSGSVFVFQHGGDDDLVWDNTDVGGFFFSFNGSGDDVVTVGDSTIGNRSFWFLGFGDDSVEFQSGNIFQNKVYNFGSLGTDSFEFNPDNQFRNGRRQYGIDSLTVDDTAVENRQNDPQTGAKVLSDQLQEEIDPSESQILDLDLSGNQTVQSSDTLLVSDPLFNVSGTTLANSNVEIDVDGDGQTDGSATADDSGSFSIDVNLIHDDQNNGANQVSVRSTSPHGSELTQLLDIHLAIGDVVRLETTLGNIDIELLEDDAPLTSQNFLNYLDRFASSIFHRSAKTGTGGDFIIQGGGFTFDNDAIAEIVEDAAVASELNPANSNLRGTLGVALPSDVNGPLIDEGTSQWYINLNDENASLDSSFTVFARIIGSGLDVADAIHTIPAFDITNDFGQGALAEVPLIDYDQSQVATSENFVFVNSALLILDDDI